MIAIDTNILVRFLVRDVEVQARKVYDLFQQVEKDKDQLFISSLVILETIWVLESFYNILRADLINSLGSLVLMPIFKFEHHSGVQNFLNDAKNNSFDLSDLLIMHCSKFNKCDSLLTFDKKAAKHNFAKLLS